MAEKLAVDEQMIHFKGRYRFKHYLLAKPKKWGYKILIFTGTVGPTQNFEIGID